MYQVQLPKREEKQIIKGKMSTLHYFTIIFILLQMPNKAKEWLRYFTLEALQPGEWAYCIMVISWQLYVFEHGYPSLATIKKQHYNLCPSSLYEVHSLKCFTIGNQGSESNKELAMKEQDNSIAVRNFIYKNIGMEKDTFILIINSCRPPSWKVINSPFGLLGGRIS